MNFKFFEKQDTETYNENIDIFWVNFKKLIKSNGNKPLNTIFKWDTNYSYEYFTHKIMEDFIFDFLLMNNYEGEKNYDKKPTNMTKKENRKKIIKLLNDAADNSYDSSDIINQVLVDAIEFNLIRDKENIEYWESKYNKTSN